MRACSTLLAGALIAATAACGPIVIPRSFTEQERAEAVESKGRRAHVETVAGWLTGSFSSEAQAATDPAFRDVRVRTARVWETRQDGIWLYVEQAVAETPDKPYRQRVYRFFVQPNGLIVIEIYTLPGEALRFAGAWKYPDLLDKISAKQLVLRGGCELVLKQVSETEWGGGNVGNTCESDRPGTAYTTSEIRITPQGFDAFDRGYDDKGALLWGPKAAYEFKRE